MTTFDEVIPVPSTLGKRSFRIDKPDPADIEKVKVIMKEINKVAIEDRTMRGAEFDLYYAPKDFYMFKKAMKAKGYTIEVLHSRKSFCVRW